MGTGCLGFGGGPNKEVDYFAPPLGKLITPVPPRLVTNQLVFGIARNSGKRCACYAKNLIEILKHNNCVTWKKSYAILQ